LILKDKSGKPAMNLSGIVVQPQPLTTIYPSGSIEANEQVEILSVYHQESALILQEGSNVRKDNFTL
jgi:hypothetical protein